MFYVYAHYTLDTNSLFYVGKGLKQRAWSKFNRNKYWHNIAQKHGYYVKLLILNITELEALSREKALIRCLKKRGLCQANLTLGGGGISGFKFSKESRLKMSKSRRKLSSWNLGKKHTKEHILKATRHGMQNGMFGTKRVGPQNPMFGKTFTKESRIKLSKSKQLKLYKTPYGTFGTLKEAASTLGLTRQAIGYRVKSKTFKDWIFEYV